MSNLIANLTTVTRLYAIFHALDYDLSDLSHQEHQLTGAAARLYRANFAAWKLTRQ